MTEKIPDEVLHAFSEAYKFRGGSRASGNGMLQMTVPSYGQEWVTIDLYRGLRAALREHARIKSVAATSPVSE